MATGRYRPTTPPATESALWRGESTKTPTPRPRPGARAAGAGGFGRGDLDGVTFLDDPADGFRKVTGATAPGCGDREAPLPALADAWPRAPPAAPGSPAPPPLDWATRLRTAWAPPTAISGTLTATATRTTTMAAIALGLRRIRSHRSEEHTSELQSLR